jgi:HEAT repeat protein
MKKDMNRLYRLCFSGALLLSLLTGAPSVQAQRKPAAPVPVAKSEAELIQDLAPANSEEVITHALGKLEDLHKADISRTNGIPAMKKLLTDSRSSVRRKAARVLGVIHAPMDRAEIDQVCQLLKSDDWKERVDGLKSLRGLDASRAVPQILPLLHDSQENVVRDSCRTLAVLGNKGDISSIEPLLNNPNKAIAKDAYDAIALLRIKP